MWRQEVYSETLNIFGGQEVHSETINIFEGQEVYSESIKHIWRAGSTL